MSVARPTIEVADLGAEVERLLEQVARAPEPVMLTRNGEPAALIVPAGFASPDEELTPEELAEIREGIQQAKAQVEAGEYVTLEEAKHILQAKWAEQGG